MEDLSREWRNIALGCGILNYAGIFADVVSQLVDTSVDIVRCRVDHQIGIVGRLVQRRHAVQLGDLFCHRPFVKPLPVTRVQIRRRSRRTSIRFREIYLWLPRRSSLFG